eukprot:59586_1
MCDSFKLNVRVVDNGENDIELKEIKDSLLNDGDNNKSVQVCGFIKYFDKLCTLNGAELRTVGIHSPITEQFAKGLSGIVGVLHYPINFRGDQFVDDIEWESDDDSHDNDDDDDQFDEANWKGFI